MNLPLLLLHVICQKVFLAKRIVIQEVKGFTVDDKRETSGRMLVVWDEIGASRNSHEAVFLPCRRSERRNSVNDVR